MMPIISIPLLSIAMKVIPISNWTDVFEHEFDLPEVGGPRNADDSGQDA